MRRANILEMKSLLIGAMLAATLLAGCAIAVSFPGYQDDRYPPCPPAARVPDAQCYGGPP